MFIFICGNSGSGKSFYAEKRLSGFSSEKKIYLATAKILDFEMSERVKKHKLMRQNKNFITIECEKNLDAITIPEHSSVLVESLTTWLSNEMFDSTSQPQMRDTHSLSVCGEVAHEVRRRGKSGEGLIISKIFSDFNKLKSQCENIILVSDYIFSDGIIYDDFTENYVKALADLTKKFANEADEVFECISGLILRYKI